MAKTHSMARLSRDKEFAAKGLTKRKVSYEHNLSNTLWVMLSIKGTFWPYVVTTHEVYLFPALHTGLVIWQAHWRDSQSGGDDDSTIESDEGESTPLGSGFWGEPTSMVPWVALGMITPLMTFTLVFFLSQCYSRFMTYFYACQRIETSIQDLTILMLCHASAPADRWDAVRYQVAAAMTMYMCVTDLAKVDDNGRRCKAEMDSIDWARLLEPERHWQAEHQISHHVWEAVMGWPRSREEENTMTKEMHELYGTIPEPPERRHECPALLTVREVNMLREYPDDLLPIVLLVWSNQVLKDLERKGELKGPSLAQAQGTTLKLRMGSRKIRNLLSLPIPLPYFHTLVVMQNLCYGLYSYALLGLGSNLTPIMVLFMVLVSTGLREVGVAISNPFGRDDVDFPIDKWIAQLRSMAIIVHPSNRPAHKPSPDKNSPLRKKEEDEESDEEDEDEGDGDGDGGDGGGDGAGGADGDDADGDDDGGIM